MREHECNTRVKNEWCHAIIVAIVTTHGQDNPGFESYLGKWFFSSPKCPDLLWGRSSFLSSKITRASSAEVKKELHLHSTKYALIACTATAFYEGSIMYTHSLMQLEHNVPGWHKVNYEAQGFSPSLFNLSCRYSNLLEVNFSLQKVTMNHINNSYYLNYGVAEECLHPYMDESLP